MQGKSHVSAQHAPSRKDAWVSRAHEHEERPSGAEAPPREGPQASNGQQRVASRPAAAEVPSSTNAFAAAPSSSRSTSGASKSTAATARCSSCPTACAVGRLGIAATRKLGGAVQRNRAKRLIREVFRRNKIAPGFDVVVIPKRELLDASLSALEADYRTLSNDASASGAERRVGVRAGAGAASRLQDPYFSVFSGLVPVPALVRRLRGRGDRAARRRPRRLAGRQAPGPLSPACAPRATTRCPE